MAATKTTNEKYKEWSFRVILVVLSVFLSSAFTVRFTEKENTKSLERGMNLKLDKSEFKEHCEKQEEDRSKQQNVNTQLLIAIKALNVNIESMNKNTEKLERRLDSYDNGK